MEATDKELRDAAMWVIKAFEEWWDATNDATLDVLWENIQGLRTALAERERGLCSGH